MKNNGQTSMEYLITYGWAILIVIIVGVVLWQLGVFDEQKAYPTINMTDTTFNDSCKAVCNTINFEHSQTHVLSNWTDSNNIFHVTATCNCSTKRKCDSKGNCISFTQTYFEYING